MAFHAIRAGEGDVYVAAGVESITQVDGYPKDAEELHRKLFGDDAPIANVYIPMGMTAENVAEQYGVSRDDMDRFAQRSQERAVAAQDSRLLRPRDHTFPGQRQRGLPRRRPAPASRRSRSSQSLDPAFKPGGSVTAGNSCPLNDGAAAVVVMSDTKAKELGVQPRARIIASVRERPSSRRSWASARSRAVRRVLDPGRHDDRRRRRDGAERSIRGAGDPRLPPRSGSTRSARSSTRTAARSRSATRTA